MSRNRKLARSLAAEAISQGKPLEWFETLYRQAAEDESIIPWADMRVNPNLAAWLERAGPVRLGGRALVIGCGLGDDAEALKSVGFKVTAFDISAACIAWCRRRFPKSEVDYVVADLHRGQMPWPLVCEELGGLDKIGLTIATFEVYVDSEDPPVRRFRIEYHSPINCER